MAKDRPAKGKAAKKSKEQDIVSQQKAAADKAVEKAAGKKAVADKADASKKSANKTAVSAKKSDKDSKKTAKSGKQAPKKEGIFKKIANYFRNVRLEIKRTTWPTRPEVLRMSLIVMGALLFFGVYIFGIDQGMTRLVELYSGIRPAPEATDVAPVEEGTAGDDTTGADGADDSAATDDTAGADDAAATDATGDVATDAAADGTGDTAADPTADGTTEGETTE